MILILKALEPICFEANAFISNLDEDVEEVIFIEQGMYDIGFNLNHMKRFKLRFGPKTVVGAFNVCFDKHQMFIYKTVTQCSGYFVRKLRWKQIMEMFNEFDIIMKRKVLFEFIVRVIRPVKKFREDDLKKQPHLAEAQQASFKFEDVNFGKIEQIELEKAVQQILIESGHVELSAAKLAQNLDKKVEDYGVEIHNFILNFEKKYQRIAQASTLEELIDVYQYQPSAGSSDLGSHYYSRIDSDMMSINSRQSK